MTLMMPHNVPAETTASEKEVFELIRNAKNSTDYVCLHSVGIARHKRKEYAETDFVIIGPPGIFCLEVKGGHIHRSGGTWEIGWPGKTYFSSEGPFKQAQGARWALIDYLNESLKLNVRKNFLFGWGVVFPDIEFNQKDPEWDPRVIYDQRDKAASFISYVERLADYFRSRTEETDRACPPRLTPPKIRQLVSCLRRDFNVVQSARGLIAESERELISLSTDQFRALDLALNDSNPRILCIGGAGSGKTLVAMEASQRLAASGKQILLLCFNYNLDRFLRLDASVASPQVFVSTVHRFFHEIIQKGGFGEQLASARKESSTDALFSMVYPDLFERSAEVLIEEGALPQFDALVIDEAQDVLEPDILNCLDLVLDKGFAGGQWMICLDSGLQAGVYGRMDENLLARLKSLGAATVLLRENFRNPKNVVAEMCTLTGAVKPICKRELVSNVEYRPYNGAKDQGKKLRALLVELLRDGVSPRHITVLSAVTKSKACISVHPPDIGKTIHFLDSDSRNCPDDALTAATISGFKGLENEFIVLSDLPPITQNTNWARSIFYVGMTRARTKLFALVDESFLQVRAHL